MLEHHPDAQCPCLGWICDPRHLALPANISLVWTQHAIDDFDQGAFAGAIFTEQGVNLAGRNIQIDVVVGDATRERFTDAGQ